jgi:hypothetical protein
MGTSVRSRRALPAILAASALALSGCIGAASADGVFTDVNGGGGGGGSNGGAVAAPGVTDDTVKVVYIENQLGSISDQLGFVQPDRGEPAQQFQLMVEWANENGGIAGRQIEPVVKPYEASTDSPEAVDALCNAITQDEQAFAVILNGQLQPNARPCYAKRSTLMLEGGVIPMDTQGFTDLAPFYWAPSLPEYDEYMSGMLNELEAGGFFDGAAGVGLVANDDAVVDRVIETIVNPKLAELGFDNPPVYSIDPSNVGNINKSLEQAVVGLISAGADRVLFLGDSRLGPFYITIADIQQYNGRLAIGSYDSPRFLADNGTQTPPLIPQKYLNDSQGISLLPVTDVRDDQLPFPATEGEQECLDIYKAKGLEFAGRGEAQFACITCDQIRFLKAAADKGGDELSARSVETGAWQLGEDFKSAVSPKSKFEEGRYAGNVAYRGLRFDQGAGAYVYDSLDLIDLPEVES